MAPTHSIIHPSRLQISLNKMAARKSGSGSQNLIENQKHGYSATAASSGSDDPRDIVSDKSSEEKMVIQKKTTVAVHYGDPLTL